MKIEFWKHETELFIGWISLMILSSILFIGGIILSIKDIDIYWPVLLSGTIMLIISFCSLFFEKRTLSKVIFSEEGIEWKWLNKKIAFINWDDVIDVVPTPHGRGEFDLTFVSNKCNIDLGLTKKMYKAIMQICPNPNLKMIINNIDCFKYFHRD